mgnify:CR=1 FL=1
MLSSLSKIRICPNSAIRFGGLSHCMDTVLYSGSAPSWNEDVVLVLCLLFGDVLYLLYL